MGGGMVKLEIFRVRILGSFEVIVFAGSGFFQVTRLYETYSEHDAILIAKGWKTVEELISKIRYTCLNSKLSDLCRSRSGTGY